MSSSLKYLNLDDSIRIYTSALHENEHIMSQTLSLHDPASLQRITLPCRAFDCRHLQCFDFSVILALNKDCKGERSFFKCSVCNQLRNPEKLYIDFVAFGLLKLYSTSESVKLFRNGSIQATGPIGTEFEGLGIKSIFDMKKLCDLPYFKKDVIQLKQLHYMTAFDIVNDMNKMSNEALILMIRGKEKSKGNTSNVHEND